MASRIYGKRAMLNLPGYGTTAAIVAEAYELADGTAVVKLAVSDCDRSLNFEMSDLGSGKQFENDLHKLDTIIGCCQELRNALVALKRQRDRRRDGADDVRASDVGSGQ